MLAPDASKEVPKWKLGNGAQRTLDGYLPVIEGKLYLGQNCSGTPLQQDQDEDTVFFTLSRRRQYAPFCADFGPINLGTTHQMCKQLHRLLTCTPLDQKIVYYTTDRPEDISNSMFLLGAFLCINLGVTPEKAWQPFAGLDAVLSLPFRDATWAKSSFDLHVQDCLAGLQRAVTEGFFKTDKFDCEEYFYYDSLLNGDMHEVVPNKFIALRGPMGDHLDQNTTHQAEPSAEEPTWSHGKCASDFIQVFKHLGVSTVVRLNSSHYKASTFVDAGFDHVDLRFTDCSTPSDSIVDSFLRLAERDTGILAVHCLAGLGRTGTLIGLFIMKHHNFTAREAIAWLRICRPGSIIGPQQAYLEQQQSRMHQLGGQGCAGLGNTWKADHVKSQQRKSDSCSARQIRRRMCTDERRVTTPDETKLASTETPSHLNPAETENEGKSRDMQSALLAHMVTQGMHHRHRLRSLHRDEKAIAQISGLPGSPSLSESKAAERRLRIQCLKRMNHTDSKVLLTFESHAVALPADKEGNTEFFMRVFSSPDCHGVAGLND